MSFDTAMNRILPPLSEDAAGDQPYEVGGGGQYGAPREGGPHKGIGANGKESQCPICISP